VVYKAVAERDMPSNNTVERLRTRTGLPGKRVLRAIEFLWGEDTGWLRMDEQRQTGIRGYYVASGCKKKTLADLDALYAEIEAARQETLEAEDADEDDDDFDPDDEWNEMDEEDDDEP
jgi:hypothetical protein